MSKQPLDLEELTAMVKVLTKEILHAFEEANISLPHSMMILMNVMVNCAMRRGLTKKQLLKDFTEVVNVVPGDDWADWVEKLKRE